MCGKKINLWIMSSLNPREKKFYKKISRDFKLEYNTEVQLKKLSWSKAYSKLIKSFKENEAPDVFQLGTTWVNTFAHLGYLAKKPSFLSRKALTNWFQERCCYQGNIIAIPWDIEVKALLVNKSITKYFDISIPNLKNRDYFYSICYKIKEKRNQNSIHPFPIVFPLKANKTTLHIFTAWLYASGGSFPDLSNTIPKQILRTRDCLENFQAIIKLIKAASKNEEYNFHQKHMYEIYQQFENQEQLFYAGEWQLRITEDDWQDSPYTIIPVPAPQKINQINKGGGSVLCVSSTNKSPGLSWELIKKLTSEKYIDLWIEATGRLPAFQTSLWNRRFDEKMVQKAYTNALKTKGYPRHPLWSKVEGILNEGITSFIWNKLTSSQKKITKKDYNHPILKKADKKAAAMLKYSWDF